MACRYESLSVRGAPAWAIDRELISSDPAPVLDDGAGDPPDPRHPESLQCWRHSHPPVRDPIRLRKPSGGSVRGASPVGFPDPPRWDHPIPSTGMDGAQCGRPAPDCCGSDSGVSAAVTRDHSARAHGGLTRVSATQSRDVSQPAGRGGPHTIPGRRAVCGTRPGRLSYPLGEAAVLQQPGHLPPEVTAGQSGGLLRPGHGAATRAHILRALNR